MVFPVFLVAGFDVVTDFPEKSGNFLGETFKGVEPGFYFVNAAEQANYSSTDTEDQQPCPVADLGEPEPVHYCNSRRIPSANISPYRPSRKPMPRQIR
jgi:hypothetical protein